MLSAPRYPPLDLNKLGIKDLLAIVYGGLYHEDKTLTIQKVGDLIDEYSNLNEVAEKLGEALTAAFGGGPRLMPTTL